MRVIHRQVATVWLLSLCAIAGCQPAKPGRQRASVSGQVTLDGKEIAQGSIAFFPTGATSGMTAGGPIREGKFSISAEQGPVVGTNRVEIHASRKSGRKVPAAMGQRGEMDDELVEAVPPRFSSASTLERTIDLGVNTLNFDLTTK